MSDPEFWNSRFPLIYDAKSVVPGYFGVWDPKTKTKGRHEGDKRETKADKG